MFSPGRASEPIISSLNSLLGTIAVVAASKLPTLGSEGSGDCESHRNGPTGLGGRPFRMYCFWLATLAFVPFFVVAVVFVGRDGLLRGLRGGGDGHRDAADGEGCGKRGTAEPDNRAPDGR